MFKSLVLLILCILLVKLFQVSKALFFPSINMVIPSLTLQDFINVEKLDVKIDPNKW